MIEYCPFSLGKRKAMILRRFLHTVRFMLADIPPAPPAAARIRAENAGFTAVAA